MYTRASASDWDDFKMPGWNAKKDLLPLMKRLENYQKPCSALTSNSQDRVLRYFLQTMTCTARRGQSKSPTAGRSPRSLKTSCVPLMRLGESQAVDIITLRAI